MRLNAGLEVMHTRAWIIARNSALLVAAAAALAGCGSHSDGTAATQAPLKTIGRKALNPADDTSHMVSAVAASKPSTLPVQLKFDLHDRPDIGQPLDIDLAIVPMSASVDRVAASIEGEDGLELLDGGQIAPTDHPPEGVPIRHSVKVLAKREGIFTLHAVLTVDASGQSSTGSYSVPVIAAAPESDAPVKPQGAPAKPPGSPKATGSIAAAASARVSEPAHPAPGTAAASQ
jgi:hypothetical protein